MLMQQDKQEPRGLSDQVLRNTDAEDVSRGRCGLIDVHMKLLLQLGLEL